MDNRRCFASCASLVILSYPALICRGVHVHVQEHMTLERLLGLFDGPQNKACAATATVVD